MTPILLQDRLQRGLGVAARRIGSIHEVMRPQGVGPPLARANRVLRLHASFNAEDPAYRKPQRYGQALWWGVFDSAATRSGDYLVGPDATYFVASQQPLLPIQCVQTNRVVTVWRPLGAGGAGASGYGGVRELAGERLIERWPASILVRGGGGTGRCRILDRSSASPAGGAPSGGSAARRDGPGLPGGGGRRVGSWLACRGKVGFDLEVVAWSTSQDRSSRSCRRRVTAVPVPVVMGMAGGMLVQFLT